MDIIWLIFDKIKKIFEIDCFILNIYIYLINFKKLFEI